MDSFKKKKLRDKIKQKKGWFIGTGIFLLLGIGAWITGSYLSGENPWIWLTGRYAITLYILIGLCLCVGGILLYIYFMQKEGKK